MTMTGETLGNWRLGSKLGEGGMGVVYAAEHVLIGQRAAVKLLLPELSQEPEVVARFFNEARAVSMIRHPGLIQIYDFGHHASGSAFIVMELLQGDSVRTRLERQGPLPPALAAAIVWQVASALEATHAQGIVHRDLKPDNLFLVPDSEAPLGLRVKVFDFGIAKLGGGQQVSVKTKTGTVIGTPAYMSPEQCRNAAKVDGAADIYSLGCIYFELLTGRPPFDGEGLGEVLGAHIYAAPPQLTSRVAGISPALEHRVQAMLAKTAPARPTATALLRELAAEAGQLAASTGPHRGAPGGAATPGPGPGPARLTAPEPPPRTPAPEPPPRTPAPEPPPRLTAPEPAPRLTAPEPAPRTPAPAPTPAPPPPYALPPPHLAAPQSSALSELAAIGRQLAAQPRPPHPQRPVAAAPTVPGARGGGRRNAIIIAALTLAVAGFLLLRARSRKQGKAGATATAADARQKQLPMFDVKAQLGCLDRAGPCRGESIDDLLVDRTEVAAADWERCVAAQACPALPAASDPQLPRTGVTRSQAETYCKWAGGRLPTPDEHEAIARGSDARPMPWGQDPATCARANLMGCGAGPLPVGGRQGGASPFGPVDVVGNVAEWTGGRYATDVSPTWIMGGSYLDAAAASYPTYRTLAAATLAAPHIGFRCVKEAQSYSIGYEEHDKLQKQLATRLARLPALPALPRLAVQLEVAVSAQAGRTPTDYTKLITDVLAAGGVDVVAAAPVRLHVDCVESPYGSFSYSYGGIPPIGGGGSPGTEIKCTHRLDAPDLGQPPLTLEAFGRTQSGTSDGLYESAIKDLGEEASLALLPLWLAVASGQDARAPDLARHAVMGKSYSGLEEARKAVVELLGRRQLALDPASAAYLAIGRADFAGCAALGAPCVGAVVDWLESTYGLRDRLPAARALVVLGSVAEPALRGMLHGVADYSRDGTIYDSDSPELVELLQALGKVGTVDSVPALERFTKDRRPDVARAARDATAAMQARP
ncbi:MAG: protein kinase [Deltaproteobacteria bacterium]|nr:protein kinase [Deltaproteobacteria bacterium]